MIPWRLVPRYYLCVPSFTVWGLMFVLCWCWGFMPSGLYHYITDLLIPDILKELVSPLLSIRTQMTSVLSLHSFTSQIWLIISTAVRTSNNSTHISVVRSVICSNVWGNLFNFKLEFIVLIMNAIIWRWISLMTTTNCLKISSILLYS